MSRRRRRLVGATVALAAAALLLSPLCGPPPLEAGAYVQAVTGREAVVCSTTAAPARLGVIVRRGGTVVAEVSAGAARTRHELRVADLEPGTRYEFETRDAAGQTVDRGSFVTRSEDDAAPVRFAILGDSGGQPWWIDLQDTPLSRALRAHRWLPAAAGPRAVGAVLHAGAPDFWLHTGDVVYPKGEREHYRTGFFVPFGETLQRAPCYPVLGNHDVMTEDGAPFFETFVLPGSPAGDERYFTFRDGPLRVIGLDLNHEIGPGDPALAFLRRVAEASTEPWLLVLSHYPVRSVYRDRPRPDLEAHFVPLCRELGVDLLCAGHDHNYQRFGEPGETIEIVTGGGGKSLYEVLHRPAGLVVAEVAYHVCFVEIEGAVLRFTARAIDGRVLDRFEIDKSELLRSGRVRGGEARLDRLRALAR